MSFGYTFGFGASPGGGGPGLATLTPDPQLDINLWGNTYVGDTLSNVLSVSRAATAFAQDISGVLSSFGANVLRRTNLGLLVESASTNRLLQSLFAASWNPTRATATGSQAGAPDTTATAVKFASDNTLANTHFLQQSVTKAASALIYTTTVYAKAAEYKRIAIQLDDGTGGQIVGFDLAGGQVAYGPTQIVDGRFTSPSAQISALANGWYRCQVILTTNTATTIRTTLWLDNGLGTAAQSTSFDGVTGSGVLLWHAQQEQVGFASSPIPTTVAAVTRDADIVSIAGLLATDLAAATGTLVIGTDKSQLGVAATLVSANSIILLGKTAANAATVSVGAGLTTAGTGPWNVKAAMGIAWSAGGRSLGTSTGALATDATAMTPAAAFKLEQFNGYVRQIKVWTSRLIDNYLALELAALSPA